MSRWRMNKKDFLKVMGHVYALGIQNGKTEEEMMILAQQLKDEWTKRNCSQVTSH